MPTGDIDRDHNCRRGGVRVKLTCGCTILVRHNPYRDQSTFACDSGQRHGYSLGWTSWTDPETGRSGSNHNPKQ